MTRIPGVPAEKASLFTRLAYRFAARKYGQVPEPATIYADSSAFTATEKRVIAYADAMTDQPMTVTDEQVAALRAELCEEKLVELTYAIALENQRSRFNHALGLTAQGFTSGDACPVPASAT